VVAVASNQVAGKVGGLALGVNTPIDTASGVDLAVAGGRGTVTGGKAVVNAGAGTAVSTLTLGTKNYAGPLTVTAYDRAIGYNASYGFARVGTEIGAGLGTGALSQFGRIGRVATAWDTAGNAVGLGQGVGNAYQQGGLTWQNSVQIVGNAAGLSGNLAGAARWVSVPQSTGTRFGPHVAGPLPAKVAGTFRGGSYSQVALQSDTVLYRTYGGTSQNPIGSYWSRTPPSGPLQARMDLALPPGNTAQGVTQIRVPQGTVIFEGSAGPNFGQLGGGNQVYIPKVNPGWVQP
jgi:hypothetical protein